MKSRFYLIIEGKGGGGGYRIVDADLACFILGSGFVSLKNPSVFGKYGNKYLK